MPPSPLPIHDGLPTPPPKDEGYLPGMPMPGLHGSISIPRPSWPHSPDEILPNPFSHPTQQLAGLSPVERSKNLRVARMDPVLQFMAGPLLRYDTVDSNGVWHGAALIVSESPALCAPLPQVWTSKLLSQPPMQARYTSPILRSHTDGTPTGRRG